jgi:hypothetical protein
MRRRSTSQPAGIPAAASQPKPVSVATQDRTFRVNTGNDKEELVTAAKMDVQDNGLTFKDSKGQVVAVFRGYGISAVADDSAKKCQGDVCESVKASDFY